MAVLREGDKVRVSNVDKHMFAGRYISDGDVSEVTAVGFYLGFMPIVFVRATKDASDNEEVAVAGIPFAADDIDMLTKIEE